MSASSNALEKRRRGRGMISNHDGLGAVDDGERLGITVNGSSPAAQPLLSDLAPPSTARPILRTHNASTNAAGQVHWLGEGGERLRRALTLPKRDHLGTFVAEA